MALIRHYAFKSLGLGSALGLHWHGAACALCNATLLSPESGHPLDPALSAANEIVRRLERHRCRRPLYPPEREELGAAVTNSLHSPMMCKRSKRAPFWCAWFSCLLRR